MIEVVAGVLHRDGRVLIAKRPAHKRHGGLWEFPGGKIESGEDAHMALVRELREELGIEIAASAPLVSVRDGHIALHARRVEVFAGEPQALEHDQVVWAQPRELLRFAMPPVDRPVRARLACGPRWLITPEPEASNCEAWLSRWLPALRLPEPPDLISVRTKSLGETERAHFAAQALAAARRVSSTVILLRHTDHPISELHGFDGAHFSQSAARACTQRRPAAQLLAISTHDSDELDHAERIGADLVCLGPVHSTASHPEATPMGWPAFAALTRNRALPVYALGGVAIDQLPLAQQQGAHGIAAIRSWLR